MIVIVNYGVGNINSIFKMLVKIGAEVIISTQSSDIIRADKLILPGIGAFDEAMRNLRNSGLISVLTKKVVEEKTPILGICLGMQLFTKDSEEGSLAGLGWINAKTVMLGMEGNHADKIKVPHMSWNTVNILKQSCLFNGLPQESRFYFAHSYRVVCIDEQDVLAQTNYGHEFISSIQRDNIYGVQFHPEKSHRYGMQLLKNFAEQC
jgi:glutamine amidotransferase